MAPDSTFTNNLGLEKPDPLQPIDVTKLNGNFDKIDHGTIPLFPSTGARDTAYTISPFKLAVVGASFDVGTLWQRRSGAWYEVNPEVTNPCAIIYNISTSQTIARNSVTPVAFNAVTAGSNGYDYFTAASQKFNITKAAWYRLAFNILFQDFDVNTHSCEAFMVDGAGSGPVISLPAVRFSGSVDSGTILNASMDCSLAAAASISTKVFMTMTAAKPTIPIIGSMSCTLIG
jgi:hypothetical protein